MRRFFFSLLTLILLSASLMIGSTIAQSDERCFAETRFCISDKIRIDWEQNGNLPVFGFPISESRQEINREDSNSYMTQWFERNRFELHFVETSADGTGRYQVLLGRLGDDRLRQQGRNWQTFPKASPNAPYYFAQTGHAIAPQFINYWRTHGLELGHRGVSFAESLALFGYPLSEAQPEEVAPGVIVLTQWFERARFEYHPNNPAPYKVLLGRLGAELQNAARQAATGERLLFLVSTGVNPNIKRALYTINADGSGQTWMRINPQIDANSGISSAAWSPDGQKIAVTVGMNSAGWYDLYIMNRDGSGLRQIAQIGSAPTWSPDGKRIAYLIHTVDQYDIYSIGSDGSGKVQLTDTPESEEEISWSPDGSHIAFTSKTPNTDEMRIGIIPAAGGAITLLSPQKAHEPSWSPEGQRLAFTDLSEDRQRIAVIDLSSGTVQRLSEGTRPRWGRSAAGEKIAFYEPQSSNLYQSAVDVINSDGSGKRQVGTALDGLSWSPDGRFLAVSTNIQIGYLVQILDAEGHARARTIAFGDSAEWSPR